MADQRTDFVPLAPVTLVRTNGARKAFGAFATSNSLRGTGLANAQTAAASGETIRVDAGTYTPAASFSIGKAGVSYDFAPGAYVYKTGSTATPIFSDDAGPLSGVIGGFGSFRTDSNIQSTGGIAEFIDADTDVTVCADRLYQYAAGLGSAFGISIGSGSTVRFYVNKEIRNDSYDAFIIDNPNGDVQIYSDAVIAPDNPLEWNNGDVYMNCRLIHGNSSQSSGAVIMSAQSGTLTVQDARLKIDAAGGSGYGTISGFENTVSTSKFLNCEIVGNVVFLNSGTVLLKDCTIDASAVAYQSLVINSNNVTLQNCRVIMKSTETYWVTASSAKTLKIKGSLCVEDETGVNRLSAVHSNVTLNWMGRVAEAVTVSSNLTASQVVGTSYSAYSSGTQTGLQTSYALVDFGTTDPAITIANAGDYIISCHVVVQDDGLSAAGTVGFKLRRTNNTAADVASTAKTLRLKASDEPVDYSLSLSPVLYSATAGDVIQLWGQCPEGTAFTIKNAAIVAVPRITGT